MPVAGPPGHASGTQRNVRAIADELDEVIKIRVGHVTACEDPRLIVVPGSRLALTRVVVGEKRE